MISANLTPEYLIDTLSLKPHPEGGWYGETWRGNQEPRASGSAIYFLLMADEISQWHRVDAVEIWHWYAGSALELHIHEQGRTRTEVLGVDIVDGQRPQRIVPSDAWQKAVPLAGWVLVGCTVSPGFEFAGFELAAEHWKPTER